MELLWVRHGLPERIEGGGGVPADPGLTAEGRDQAERLAEWLAVEPIDAVLSSPLRRARETAAPIAAAHGLEVVVIDGLAEYDRNSDSYIPMEELRATKNPRFDAMMTGKWDDMGEPAEVFRARIAGVLDEIITAYPGQRVVAVCHGGVVNVASALVLDIDRHLWFEPHYTSVTRMIASRSGVRSLSSLNERAHLDGRRDAPQA